MEKGNQVSPGMGDMITTPGRRDPGGNKSPHKLKNHPHKKNTILIKKKLF